MTADTALIRDATERWSEGWRSRESDKLLSLWDHTDAQAIYLSANHINPLVTSASISAYIQNTCANFEIIRHQPIDPIYRRLSESTASVFYVLNWLFQDHHGAIGGSCRVTTLWRMTDEAWRMFHYAEAPLAPLLELQTFYEEIAADGLDAIPLRTHEA